MCCKTVRSGRRISSTTYKRPIDSSTVARPVTQVAFIAAAVSACSRVVSRWRSSVEPDKLRNLGQEQKPPGKISRKWFPRNNFLFISSSLRSCRHTYWTRNEAVLPRGGTYCELFLPLLPGLQPADEQLQPSAKCLNARCLSVSCSSGALNRNWQLSGRGSSYNLFFPMFTNIICLYLFLALSLSFHSVLSAPFTPEQTHVWLLPVVVLRERWPAFISL